MILVSFTTRTHAGFCTFQDEPGNGATECGARDEHLPRLVVNGERWSWEAACPEHRDRAAWADVLAANNPVDWSRVTQRADERTR